MIAVPRRITANQIEVFFFLTRQLSFLSQNKVTIVRYAVETLAFADPIASWVGSSIKSPKINSGTSMAGSVACFGSAWIVGYLMLDNSIHKTTQITIGALACTIAEGLPLGDDNLNVPIITSLAVQHIGKLL